MILSQNLTVHRTPFNDFHFSLQAANISYANIARVFKFYLKNQDLEEDVSKEILFKFKRARNATIEYFGSINNGQYIGKSSILADFGVEEYFVLHPLVALFGFFVFFRVVAYFVLLYRSTPKK